mmetsp:Transcript_37/g.133  ORF Transcript_37/g.133 Transcript_37/m.133 type:complete len:255 (+) Transcript_37:2-766(+)
MLFSPPFPQPSERVLKSRRVVVPVMSAMGENENDSLRQMLEEARGYRGSVTVGAQLVSQCLAALEEAEPSMDVICPKNLTSIPDPVKPGTTVTMSIGSLKHDSGECKPCAFFHRVKSVPVQKGNKIGKVEGCLSGAECTFCHLCPPHEKKIRMKAAKAQQQKGEGDSSFSSTQAAVPGLVPFKNATTSRGSFRKGDSKARAALMDLPSSAWVPMPSPPVQAFTGPPQIINVADYLHGLDHLDMQPMPPGVCLRA